MIFAVLQRGEPMRLIDGDALMPKLKFIQEAEHQIYGKGSWGFASKCLTAIEDAPTIEERKNGRWIWKTGDIYRCSECNMDIHVAECMEEPIYNFCPYCGADMRGDNDA
jgi:hypothetical protein